MVGDTERPEEQPEQPAAGAGKPGGQGVYMCIVNSTSLHCTAKVWVGVQDMHSEDSRAAGDAADIKYCCTVYCGLQVCAGVWSDTDRATWVAAGVLQCAAVCYSVLYWQVRGVRGVRHHTARAGAAGSNHNSH